MTDVATLLAALEQVAGEQDDEGSADTIRMAAAHISECHKSGDGWKLLDEAAHVMGSMAEDDFPGCEAAWLALLSFLRQNGHPRQDPDGPRYMRSMQIVDAMKSPPKPNCSEEA